jgi:hypothetical protein
MNVQHISYVPWRSKFDDIAGKIFHFALGLIELALDLIFFHRAFLIVITIFLRKPR